MSNRYNYLYRIVVTLLSVNWSHSPAAYDGGAAPWPALLVARAPAAVSSGSAASLAARLDAALAAEQPAVEAPADAVKTS